MHPPADPWGEAVARFLGDLLDDVAIDLVYAPDGPPNSTRPGPPAQPWSAVLPGPTGWSATLNLHLSPGSRALYGATGPTDLPSEFTDLPGAAARAIDRITVGADPAAGGVYPTLAVALHDVVVAEILAEKVSERSVADVPADVALLVSDTLSYVTELSQRRVEGRSLTHGVVIGPATTEVAERRGQVSYPADVRALKRTPLLFDGLRSCLAVGPSGAVQGEITRRSLAALDIEDLLEPLEEALGDAGALVAAASRALNGVGFFLAADQAIWIFDQGQPLMLRRGGRWKAIPFASLIGGLAELVGSQPLAALVARTALLASLDNHGAIIAVVDSSDRVEGVVEPKDRYDVARSGEGEGPAEFLVHRLLHADDLDVATLLRLAVIDGATVLDSLGQLLAYGAIVRSESSQGEGARTAAARTLSRVARVVLRVSEDGPIAVFVDGAQIATLL
ncbi:MAG: hypothetical protein GEV08_00235 [Acidimicrobiia bacterium]|nr:hypothetical protein [Acidimicrobiia bacterium]